jgi:hypothetical protein
MKSSQKRHKSCFALAKEDDGGLFVHQRFTQLLKASASIDPFPM